MKKIIIGMIVGAFLYAVLQPVAVRYVKDIAEKYDFAEFAEKYGLDEFAEQYGFSYGDEA